MADSPKQRASSIAEEPQQDDALASDDDDGAPAAKPHPPVGGSPKPHPPVTGSPKRPGETPLRVRSRAIWTYSEENLAIRERLATTAACRMLERWWSGSSAHDDRDKNEALDHDEYERFYARLVHLVDPDDEMTELEIARPWRTTSSPRPRPEHANAEDAHNDWLWLFSRMVGCRISGRIKSIHAGRDFVCKAFDEIEGMLKDSKRSLPSKLKSASSASLPQKWLAANVFRPLRISENDEPQLLHAILRVLEKMARSLESEARAQSITNADVNNFKVKDLVTCVEVMVLISNVWCAMHYDEFENRQKEKREQGREGGAAAAGGRGSQRRSADPGGPRPPRARAAASCGA
ncbi:hypothetical protein JL722_8591 [Aureococcus anophagefferens]|nr:hypothetical protein JL722_8591 [Aureococcus anophagefferens]